jgi:hypothetical protein
MAFFKKVSYIIKKKINKEVIKAIIFSSDYINYIIYQYKLIILHYNTEVAL